MAEFDVTTGFDAWVSQAQPALNTQTGRFPALRGGVANQFQIFLSMPLALSDMRGRTVLAGELSPVAQGLWVPQEVSVRACAASWNVATLNWNNKPGVTGATASKATGALDPGERFSIDVKDLLQAIADGQPNYGWRITTDQSTDRSTVRGFDYAGEAWTLHVEMSDRLAKPTQLAPAGTISVAKPVLLVDDVDDLQSIQVQIDAAANPAAVDFDSGWFPTSSPQLPLASTAYAGLADGASTWWRARLKTLNGSVTAWSDWVQVTRHVKPGIVMDVGTDIWDPTPDVAAHLDPAGSADTRWQVIFHTVGDPTDVLYNSGDALEGATLEHQVPLQWRGKKVLRTDGQYTRIVKAWDRTDRVPSPGDSPFVKQTDVVTVDVDLAQTAPDTLTVAMATVTPGGYPRPRLHWTRGADPDWFVVRRNGVILAIVDVDDARVAAGTWEWDDETAAPNVQHTYTVRAVTVVGGVKKQSPNSPAASILAEVLGVWFRSEFGEFELFNEDGPPEVKRVEKRQEFTLPYRPEDVDIVTAIGNYAGTYAGNVDRRHDIPATLEIIDALVNHPAAQVQVIWSTFNIYATLPGLSYAPHKKHLKNNPKYAVTMGIKQIEKRD